MSEFQGLRAALGKSLVLSMSLPKISWEFVSECFVKKHSGGYSSGAMGLGIACAGSRPQHHSCDAGFAGIQNETVVGTWRLPSELQMKIRSEARLELLHAALSGN